MRALFAFYLLLLVGPARHPTAPEKACEDQEMGKSIISALQKDAHMDLRAVPMPELDDNLIGLQQYEVEFKQGGRLPLFHVFKVTVAPYVIKDGVVSMGTIVVDAEYEWLAATNCDTNQIFFFEGYRDPLRGFNGLMKALHLQVTSTEGAEWVFDNYLRLARGQEFRYRVVGDDMNLEGAALVDFLRFPPAKRRAMFEAWWRTVPAAVMQALEPPVATETEQGFSVEFFFYDWGNIYKQTVSVSKDGTIIEEKPQIVLRSGLPE